MFLVIPLCEIMDTILVIPFRGAQWPLYTLAKILFVATAACYPHVSNDFTELGLMIWSDDGKSKGKETRCDFVALS